MLGTLTVYNSKNEVSYQAHIDKSELDDTIRDYKDSGRKLTGVFYLNGEVDVTVPSRGFTEQTIRIIFKPDNVSRETSQIKWEAGIDSSEWLRKTTDEFLKDVKKHYGNKKHKISINEIPKHSCSLTVFDDIDSPKPEPDKVLEAINLRPHVEGSISRLSTELQVSSFIQQRFTKHF